MKFLSLGAVFSVILGPAVFAQGDAVEAAAKPSAVRELYDELQEEYDAAIASWSAKLEEIRESEEYKELEAKEDREGMMALFNAIESPTATILSRARALAEEHADEPEAPLFLIWAVNHGLDDEGTAAALDKLGGRYVESEHLEALFERPRAMTRFLPTRIGAAPTREFLDELATKSPHAKVKAFALYSRAHLVYEDMKATPEALAGAKADLAAARKLVPGTVLADLAVGPRNERERLQIGMVAPEIEGEDIDGTRFRLSDYRGKVVVLDFWGDW